MPDPRITAAVCTAGRTTGLQGCLESLIEQGIPFNRYEILVVDNSPDGSVGEALAGLDHRGADIRLVRQPQPGLSPARNLALAECRGPCLAFIDDDAVAGMDWLENILVFFQAHDNTAVAVGGPVAPQWEGPLPAWFAEPLEGYFSIVDWSHECIEISDYRWLPGTNIAFRVEPVRACGGFRECLGRIGDALLSNEENELLRRVRRRGGRTFYDPAIRVTHRIDMARITPQWIRRRVAWQMVSETIMDQLEGPHADVRPDTDPFGPDVTLEALLADPEDPESFQRQLTELRKLIRTLFRPPAAGDDAL